MQVLSNKAWDLALDIPTIMNKQCKQKSKQDTENIDSDLMSGMAGGFQKLPRTYMAHQQNLWYSQHCKVADSTSRASRAPGYRW